MRSDQSHLFDIQYLIKLNYVLIQICLSFQCTYPIGSDEVTLIQRSARNLNLTKKRKFKENTGPSKKSKLHALTQLPDSLLSPLSTQNTLPQETVTNGSHTPKLAPYPTALSSHHQSSAARKSSATVQMAHTRDHGRQLSNLYDIDSYLFWKNVDALCWLDVTMCLIVKSQVLQRVLGDIQSKASSSVTSLWIRYREIQQKYNKAQELNIAESKTVGLETSVGSVPVKTGGGDPLGFIASFDQVEGAGTEGMLISARRSPIKQQNMLEDESRQDLEAIREDVWKFLQPQLKCQKGRNDSPVFALPLLIKECAVMKRLCWVEYCWRMTCTACGHEHQDR